MFALISVLMLRTEHTLPDGQKISIGTDMGAIIGELLFDPQDKNESSPGLGEICYECTVGQVRMKPSLVSVCLN